MKTRSFARGALAALLAMSLALGAFPAGHTVALAEGGQNLALLGTTHASASGQEVQGQWGPELAIDGEMQFDAAVSPVVGQLKFPGSPVAGYANTFIFPCIEAGNIGYKIAQRLGGYEAYGPILLGLNAPINDLSRGCNADEVYKMAIITAALA